MSTVDTTSYYESLLASSSTSSTSSTTSTTSTTDSSSTSSLTSEDFLTLLLAEIQYQDPTEPLENAEMVSQLTGYSQLDQLASINEQLEDLSGTITSATASNCLSYLGKTVEAEGSSITKSGEDVDALGFTLADDAESVTINVYDSDGNIVATNTLSGLSAGSYSYEWDGLDSDGEEAEDGTYTLSLSALDSDGASVEVSTITTGTVAGISMTSDGIVLTLDDGRTVNLEDVTSVTA